MTPVKEREDRGTVVGVLHHEKHSHRRVAGVSCLYWCNSPRLLAVRSAGSKCTSANWTPGH